MSDEDKNELDDAVRKWIATAEPEAMITGWVLSAVGVRPADDDEISIYFQTRSNGLPFHSALGLHHNAIHDMHASSKEVQ